MDEKELQAFAKETFQDIELDKPSSNFDHLVMERIRIESIKISAQPILSPFKWILIGFFIFLIIFGSFYFNSGNSRFNFEQLNQIFQKVNLNYTTSITILLGGFFIILQVLFLKNCIKKASLITSEAFQITMII